eukprot:TRINITY_DN3170_c0_g2_i1.p1 TRINITY_DN3170_c0_g2~~TRINITY_DN3170_c0_g2_i1.p1  ORF type:complete len:810 (-),score=257.24 TRINITY_DN3170_c0_g2_i1:80-2509(-)
MYRKIEALYDYTAPRIDCLTFSKGDILEYISVVTEGWWMAYFDSQNTMGLVPSNYFLELELEEEENGENITDGNSIEENSEMNGSYTEEHTNEECNQEIEENNGHLEKHTKENGINGEKESSQYTNPVLKKVVKKNIKSIPSKDQSKNTSLQQNPTKKNPQNQVMPKIDPSGNNNNGNNFNNFNNINNLNKSADSNIILNKSTDSNFNFLSSTPSPNFQTKSQILNEPQSPSERKEVPKQTKSPLTHNSSQQDFPKMPMRKVPKMPGSPKALKRSPSDKGSNMTGKTNNLEVQTRNRSNVQSMQLNRENLQSKSHNDLLFRKSSDPTDIKKTNLPNSNPSPPSVSNIRTMLSSPGQTREQSKPKFNNSVGSLDKGLLRNFEKNISFTVPKKSFEVKESPKDQREPKEKKEKKEKKTNTPKQKREKTQEETENKQKFVEEEIKRVSEFWLSKNQKIEVADSDDKRKSDMLKVVAGYIIEHPSVKQVGSYSLFDAENKIPFYQKYIKGKPHKNYVCMHEKEGPFVISIQDYEQDEKRRKRPFLVLIRCINNHCERILIVGKKPGTSLKEELSTRYGKLKIIKVADSIIPGLVKFEESNVITKYKFGVLYWKEGQDENQAFSNNTSEDFDEFVECLGNRIQLKGWEKYRGGLNVKDDATGKESIYTEFEGFEVMFHISTMLPFFKEDPQELERKRHLGNDVVLVVFKEGNVPFDPSIIHSQFNHVFIVVEKIKNNSNKTQYKVGLSCLPSVPKFSPALLENPVWEKGPKFREWMLYKMINGERAAMHAIDFRGKLKNTNKTYLSRMFSDFTK